MLGCDLSIAYKKGELWVASADFPGVSSNVVFSSQIPSMLDKCLMYFRLCDQFAT